MKKIRTMRTKRTMIRRTMTLDDDDDDDFSKRATEEPNAAPTKK